MRRTVKVAWTFSSCLQAQSRRHILQATLTPSRPYTSATRLQQEHRNAAVQKDAANIANGQEQEKEKGAMSRRLSDMAEETMDTGSKSDRKLMADVGFSEDLKKQLEARIAQTNFEQQNQRALGEANMPAAAGQGTRQQAAADPWMGTESTHDVTLRMLDDSHKKLRMPARAPKLGPINMRPAGKKKVSVADRLVNARDRTSMYAVSQQGGMTEDEREKMRKELKDRFSPGARPMPTSLQGLTSLANERIEDAIARGQFRNIQRGKGVNVERDYTANSPFLDTTEYFMNKIIQKQEIVPPWIEKQQELVKLVGTFRGRLRNDWKRHASRTISSTGGTVEEQVRRAQAYALTEEKINPRPARKESMTGIDTDGTLTTITIEQRIAAGVAPIEEISKTEPTQPEITIKVTETAAEDANPETPQSQPTPPNATAAPQPITPTSPSAIYSVAPAAYPFRDPQWEATELAYHTLAIKEINDLTRSYNLMAPKIAQRPYYALQRELNRCFSEVAPQLPDEILERSRKPKIRVEIVGHREGGIMNKFSGTGHVAKVRDEDEKKGYGFKEFWNDLFKKDEPPAKRRSVA